MKKLLTAIFVLSLSTATFAQTSDAKSKREGKEHKEHAKGKHFGKGDQYSKLNLTEAQKSQMQSLNESFRNKMKALKADDSNERKELAKQHQQSIQNILTPEQRKQAAEFKKDYSNKGRNRGEGRFDEMQKELNLSAQQSSRLKEINENHRQQMQELQSNTSLTDEQKKEKRRSIMEAHKQSIASVLTADQKAKMKDRMKNRPNKTRSVK
ncbi:MAG: hypothetical protein JWQ96_311 [Segetibacter sp.]|nr:hypothetical protein [Segetibacter sp.]